MTPEMRRKCNEVITRTMHELNDLANELRSTEPMVEIDTTNQGSVEVFADLEARKMMIVLELCVGYFLNSLTEEPND